MKRFYAAWMVVAATMLAGCRDDRGPSDPTRYISSTSAAHQTITGTVVASSEHRILAGLVLRLEDGSELSLDGPEAAPLVSVIGAQIEVDGTMDGDFAFAVEGFVVLAVGGAPVLDGVLESADDGAYTLRLTAGGERTIIDPSAELAAHVGERVWLVLTQDDGSGTMSFGVIRS